MKYVMPANMTFFGMFGFLTLLLKGLQLRGGREDIERCFYNLNGSQKLNYILSAFCCFLGGDLVIGVQSIKGMEIG